MALIAATAVPGSAATAISYTAAAAGGDTFAYNPSKRQIIVINNGAVSKTVTVTAQRTSVNAGRDVAALASLAATVNANQVRAVLITPAYVDSTGMVNVTYSAVTNVSVALLEF